MKMKLIMNRKARLLAILSVLLTTAITPARAALFQMDFDGSTFSSSLSSSVGVDVGWRGDALVSVDDGCLLPSTTVAFPQGCGSAGLEGYSIEFYDTNTDAVLGTSSDTAPWSPTFPFVTAISFDGSKLVIGAGLSDEIAVPGPFSFGSYSNSFDAFLILDVNGPSLRLAENCGGVECRSFHNDGTSFPPTVIWSRESTVPPPPTVPSPSPLALLSIGLLGFVGLRSKKRKEADT